MFLIAHNIGSAGDDSKRTDMITALGDHSAQLTDVLDDLLSHVLCKLSRQWLACADLNMFATGVGYTLTAGVALT